MHWAWFYCGCKEKEFSVTVLVGELWEKGNIAYTKALLNRNWKSSVCFHCTVQWFKTSFFSTANVNWYFLFFPQDLPSANGNLFSC